MSTQIIPGNKPDDSLGVVDLRSTIWKFIILSGERCVHVLAEKVVKLPIWVSNLVVSEALAPEIIEFLCCG